MTRIHLRHLLACGAACAALVAVGCGGSSSDETGPGVPAATVRQLDQRLDEIQRRYDSATQDDNQGACDDIASDSFPAITELIDRLPADTDQDVKDAVNESFANLQQLTDSGCKDVGAQTDTDTTPTETEPPQTETQTTPETDTQTTPQTDTQTTPDTTPTTPDNGGAGPGANGNGGPAGPGNGGGTGGGGTNKGGAVPPGQ